MGAEPDSAQDLGEDEFGVAGFPPCRNRRVTPSSPRRPVARKARSGRLRPRARPPGLRPCTWQPPAGPALLGAAARHRARVSGRVSAGMAASPPPARPRAASGAGAAPVRPRPRAPPPRAPPPSGAEETDLAVRRRHDGRRARGARARGPGAHGRPRPPGARPAAGHVGGGAQWERSPRRGHAPRRLRGAGRGVWGGGQRAQGWVCPKVRMKRACAPGRREGIRRPGVTGNFCSPQFPPCRSRLSPTCTGGVAGSAWPGWCLQGGHTQRHAESGCCPSEGRWWEVGSRGRTPPERLRSATPPYHAATWGAGRSRPQPAPGEILGCPLGSAEGVPCGSALPRKAYG